VKPSEFAYHRPASLPDALALLGAHAGAKPLAGGQSLIPAMNFRLAAPAALVDLNQLTELSGIAESADGGLVIGAMTRHSAVERSPLVRARAPLLSFAMPSIAHSQIRSRGTLGGSLAHADPAIRQFWVEESRRGRGLGTRLLAAAEGEARRRRCTQIFLMTFSFQAPAFYARHGFTTEATVDGFPRGHPC